MCSAESTASRQPPDCGSRADRHEGMNISNESQRSVMRKPSESSRALKAMKTAEDAGPQASHAGALTVKAWPFAPGSQQGKQVAKPWSPKTSYRFNQR
jgi:hypothetical protein